MSQNKLYYVTREGKVASVVPVKETKTTYVLDTRISELGLHLRIAKHALSPSPQEAIASAVATRNEIITNLRRQILVELVFLHKLERTERELSTNSNSPELNHTPEVVA